VNARKALLPSLLQHSTLPLHFICSEVALSGRIGGMYSEERMKLNERLVRWGLSGLVVAGVGSVLAGVVYHEFLREDEPQPIPLEEVVEPTPTATPSALGSVAIGEGDF
jgi:hypothetical protein